MAVFIGAPAAKKVGWIKFLCIYAEKLLRTGAPHSNLIIPYWVRGIPAIERESYSVPAGSTKTFSANYRTLGTYTLTISRLFPPIVKFATIYGDSSLRYKRFKVQLGYGTDTVEAWIWEYDSGDVDYPVDTSKTSYLAPFNALDSDLKLIGKRLFMFTEVQVYNPTTSSYSFYAYHSCQNDDVMFMLPVKL